MGFSLVALPFLCYSGAKYQKSLKEWVLDLNTQVGHLLTPMCFLSCLYMNGELVQECAVASPPNVKGMCAFAQPQVLVPNGMFAKFQTNEIYVDYGGPASYYENITWLAIALTEEESEILRQESAFWSPACCGNQIVASDCCTCGRTV